MITNNGIIKIGDFGSAISIDDKVNDLFEIEGFTRVKKKKKITNSFFFLKNKK